MRVTVESLRIKDEYKTACRPLFEAEMAGLITAVLDTDGAFLDPIKYHQDSDGSLWVVDGHHRYSIWQAGYSQDVEPPRIQEVIALSGATVEEVVEWIRTHQANRRNDTNEFRYQLGKEKMETGKTSPELAEEYGVSPSVVRHSEAFAKSVVMNQERKVEVRRRADTALVLTRNDAS